MHKQTALDAIEKEKKLFTELSDKIWEYAELSLKEFKSTEEYVKILEKLGFEVKVVGNGAVVTGQVPEAGSRVLKSSAKLIFYTGGQEPPSGITVPDVTGKTAAAANQSVINCGLNIKIEGSKYYHEGGGVTVESQYPAAGEVVPEGTVVTLNFGYYEWKQGRKGKQKDWEEIKLRCDFSHFNARGHYLQACVWLGFLFNVDPATFTYRPKGLPEADAKLMRECARDALKASR